MQYLQTIINTHSLTVISSKECRLEKKRENNACNELCCRALCSLLVATAVARNGKACPASALAELIRETFKRHGTVVLKPI